MESFELRLLRCSLGGGAKQLHEIGQNIASNTDHECGTSNSTEALEDGIRGVLVQIEGGFYAEVLSSRWLPAVVGEVPSFASGDGKNGDRAKEFYDFMESRIVSYLERGRWEGSAGKGQEEERQQRELMVLVLGVAVLFAFLEANMTGPVQGRFAAFPGHAALFGSNPPTGFDKQEWDAWARRQLMVDGCDIVGKITLPQYLILAKLLLVSPAEMVVNRTNSETPGPRTSSWWAFRVLLTQQRILAERSASLRSLLVTFSREFIAYFDTYEAVQRIGWKMLNTVEAKVMVAAAHLEIGLMEHVYGHDDAARECFDRAGKSCGLEVALTGILGFRTQYQTDPKAQMVLIASSKSSAEDETGWLDFLDTQDENLPYTNAQTELGEILLAPKLLDATNEDNPVEDGKPPHSDQKVLRSIEQAVILAMGVDVKKSNPDDDLRSWQMAPFIEAVDSQHHSHPMVKAWCQLLRVRWEKTRARTRERCFLMMEQLANDVREGSANVSQRMSYVFCVPFPVLPVLLKEYAELMVGFGLVGDAMELFEELELWNNLIDCYCLLGKKAAAAALIKQRLEIQPNEPRLWCSLGDVIMDNACYYKAWEVSGQRFTRAQRSLARTAFNKGNYVEAIEHWDLALALNPLHPDGWFALGSAALKARDLEKALVAFTRQVQLDPENGESWNNIAAINMQKKRSKEAFVAFREALKLKRNSWQIWENFGQVALDVANFGQAILAVEKVLDLSDEKRVDVAALTRLVEELEQRKGLMVRPTIVPETQTDGEPEIQEVENGSCKDGLDSSSSAEMDLPSTAIARGQEPLSFEELGDPVSFQESASISVESMETEILVQKTGKLLSRIVARGSGGAEIWGLKARWLRLVGDLSMYVEALLKQVRALQGSKWQNSPEEFQVFAKACLQLCDAYKGSGSTSGGKRELFSAQMLLQNTIRQAEHFNSNQLYKDMVSCLEEVELKIQTL